MLEAKTSAISGAFLSTPYTELKEQQLISHTAGKPTLGKRKRRKTSARSLRQLICLSSPFQTTFKPLATTQQLFRLILPLSPYARALSISTPDLSNRCTSIHRPKRSVKKRWSIHKSPRLRKL